MNTWVILPMLAVVVASYVLVSFWIFLKRIFVLFICLFVCFVCLFVCLFVVVVAVLYSVVAVDVVFTFEAGGVRVEPV